MRYRIFGLLLLALFSSCGKNYLYRNLMLRTGPNYPYSNFSDIQETEYRIAPDDRVDVRIQTNDGSGLINIGGGNIQVGSGGSMSIKIESDGFAKLPIFGRIYLEGLTIRQAEMLIEDKFSAFYNNPFVLVEVSNRRVMLFAGSSTQVVMLQNDNTTLFEVLAASGGITDDGKADKIKIIRGDLRNPQVYLVDLSTLSGMKNANLVMQANDIIYIETRKGYIIKAVSELGPYISILGTVISTAALISSLRAL
jgi:polysaccharide export outer membrane protein